jgi:CBS domain-containing protein
MSIQAILYDKGSSVACIAASASVKSAADKLRELNIAALIVKRAGAVLGIVSEREIVNALSLHGEKVAGMTVADILLRNVVTIAPEDSLKRAMALMTRNRTRHLLVLRDGEPAGVVSIGDVIKHQLEDLKLTSPLWRDTTIAAH